MSTRSPMIRVPVNTCTQCGHIWVQRKREGRPYRCPNCVSRRWRKPPKKKPEEFPTLTLEKDKGDEKE